MQSRRPGVRFRAVPRMAGLPDILLPVVALIAAGFAFARIGLVTEAGEAALSGIVFYAATPALLFRAMASAAPGSGDLALVAAYFGPCLALYALWAVAARVLAGQGAALCGIGAMGSVFGNTVLIGVPVVERLHGPAGLRLLVMIISIHSALLFTATTLLAEAGRGRADGRAALAGTARLMSRNPMVLSIAAGAVFGALQLRLPTPVDAALAMLGGATAPLALLAAGAGLATFRIGAQLGACALVASVKLCLFPLAAWVVARHVAGLDPLAVAVATLAAALPTGTNAYVIARRYDSGVALAAGSVLLTTLLSAATIPAVVLAVGR